MVTVLKSILNAHGKNVVCIISPVKHKCIRTKCYRNQMSNTFQLVFNFVQIICTYSQMCMYYKIIKTDN